MTDADLDLNDFFGGALNTFKIDGKTFGLPLKNETSLLSYRKDLFEQAGIQRPPTTMAELLADAALLKQGRWPASRCAAGRHRHLADRELPDVLRRHLADADGNSALNSYQSKQALAFYADLLRNYGPRGETDMSWPEVTSLFAQGQAAMIFDGNVFRSIMEDPKQATDVVRNNVGYAPLPAGPPA